MLRYTGHPFYDIGVAAITAFSMKHYPDEVTVDDLERVAAYIRENYVHDPLRKIFRGVFTNNCWFFNDAYNADKPGLSPEEKMKRAERRERAAALHLEQWRRESPTSADEVCVFTGDAALGSALADKLRPGYAASSQIPLMLGNSTINFFPYGEPGVPISGEALLALQFFPMGSIRSSMEGNSGFLVVHSNSGDMIYKFAKTFLEQNQSAALLGEFGIWRFPKTKLINILTDIDREGAKVAKRGEQSTVSLTAYLFYSDGRSQSLAIYPLPMEVVSFARHAAVNQKEAWAHLTRRNWEARRSPEDAETDSTQGERRNNFFEDLFTLPGNAPQFIRKYFLTAKLRKGVFTDPEQGNTNNIPALWPLVTLFLREVVHIEPQKIETLRAFGDRLADRIAQTGGGKFFRTFRVTRDYTAFRQSLIRELERAASEGILLFGLKEYAGVFEDADNEPFVTWRLARDLVVIRIIERLFEMNKEKTALPLEELIEDVEDSDIEG